MSNRDAAVRLYQAGHGGDLILAVPPSVAPAVQAHYAARQIFAGRLVGPLVIHRSGPDPTTDYRSRS